MEGRQEPSLVPIPSQSRELAFSINDVARLLKTHADQRAAHLGMTRAKWAVLARLDRFEGLKQTELAEMLDLQPISLTRLLDGLAENGLIERRADPADRRAKRLFLTPAARPLLDRLSGVAEDLMNSALAGLDEGDQATLLKLLATVKENLRQAIQKRQERQEKHLEQRYG
jgi:MarR family transcriptional regulator for hemolysin